MSVRGALERLISVSTITLANESRSSFASVLIISWSALASFCAVFGSEELANAAGERVTDLLNMLSDADMVLLDPVVGVRTYADQGWTLTY